MSVEDVTIVLRRHIDCLLKHDIREYSGRSFKKGIDLGGMGPYVGLLKDMIRLGQINQTTAENAFNEVNLKMNDSIKVAVKRNKERWEGWRKDVCICIRVMITHLVLKKRQRTSSQSPRALPEQWQDDLLGAFDLKSWDDMTKQNKQQGPSTAAPVASSDVAAPATPKAAAAVSPAIAPAAPSTPSTASTAPPAPSTPIWIAESPETRSLFDKFAMIQLSPVRPNVKRISFAATADRIDIPVLDFDGPDVLFPPSTAQAVGEDDVGYDDEGPDNDDDDDDDDDPGSSSFATIEQVVG